MKNKSIKTLAVILAIGLIAALAAYLMSSIVKVPTVTEHEFPYSVTYQLDGQTKTLEGVYTVRFDDTNLAMEPWKRYYTGTHRSDGDEYLGSECVIAKKDELSLCISLCFTDAYLMGDDEKNAEEAQALAVPQLVVYDREQYPLEDREIIEKFNAELVSWELPEPIENRFVFHGFSLLHPASMVIMLAVELLLLVACMIFVKKDETVSYKLLDKASVVLNFLISILVIPVITALVMAFDLTVSGDELSYQLFLGVPAFTALTVTASIALRRKGFTRTGFWIQFVGPVFFCLCLMVESAIHYM